MCALIRTQACLNMATAVESRMDSSTSPLEEKKRHHRHHHKKHHHKKHRHKKHRKKHRHSDDKNDVKLDLPVGEKPEELLLNDEVLLQALTSIDDQLMNDSDANSSTSIDEEKGPMLETMDKTTGQQHCVIDGDRHSVSGLDADDKSEGEKDIEGNSVSKEAKLSDSKIEDTKAKDLKAKKKKKKHSKSKHKTSKNRSSRRSRSHSRNRSRSRSQRSHSPSKRSHSPSERARSRTKRNLGRLNSQRARSRSRRRYHSRTRSQSKGRYRSRTRSGSRKRYHSRTRSQSRRRYRSRTRSHSGKRYRSRSRSGSKRRYNSRTRSRSRRRNDSRTRSHSRTRNRVHRRPHRDSYHSRRRSRSIRRRSRHHSSSSDSSSYSDRSKSSEPRSIPTIVTKPILSGKQEAIAQYTEVCRHLSELEKVGDAEVEEDTADQAVNHPFQMNTELVLHNDAWKTPNQMVLDVSLIKSVEEQFPVSSGLDHQKETIQSVQPQQPSEELTESVSSLVIQRASLQRQLKLNSNDIQATLKLSAIERKLASWSQGQLKPGVYSGGTGITPMPKWEHDRGIQAWAKKNMFKELAPVMSGFGVKMLRKMGWEMGTPLGKRGEGHTEPIPIDVKIDRQGLATTEDKQPPPLPSNVPAVSGKTSLAGKHPVSALQELCSKKSWGSPDYVLVSETGPSHMRSFMYKVTIEGLGAFQAACCSNNKKLAKAQAAIACLKSLGIFDDEKPK